MAGNERKELMEDELLIVRHSGEIPEVALHGVIYYLTEDPEGPNIELEEQEYLELKKMVVERYREIILRDLDPDNRNKSIYRGIARSIANWQRLEKFCKKEGINPAPVRDEACASLLSFLENEVREVAQLNYSSCVNCAGEELECFIETIQLDRKKLPADWQSLCKSPQK